MAKPMEPPKNPSRRDASCPLRGRIRRHSPSPYLALFISSRDVVEIEISSPELHIYLQMAWAGVSQEDRSPSAPSKAHKHRKKKKKKKLLLFQSVKQPCSNAWRHQTDGAVPAVCCWELFFVQFAVPGQSNPPVFGEVMPIHQLPPPSVPGNQSCLMYKHQTRRLSCRGESGAVR